MKAKSRDYAHTCGLAHALDLVGDRWALLVVRELLLGPKRFGDILAGLPGVGTATLTTRLDELERDGIVVHRRLPRPASALVYELTSRGRELQPILLALVRWGAPTLMASSPRHPLRADGLAAAMLAFFDPTRAPLEPGTVELEMPTGAVVARLADRTLVLTAAPAATADARVVATEEAILRAILRPDTLAELAISGDADRVRQLFTACPIGAR